MINDTPIHRVTFLEMTEDEQINFIKEIRERRNEPLRIYNEAIALKREAKTEKLKEKFKKAQEMFKKELEQFDKKTESLIKRANTLKQLQTEIEMES